MLGWICCECLVAQTYPWWEDKQNCVSSHAVNVDFLSTLNEFLQEGNVTTVEEIEKHYKIIASGHGLKKKKRWALKQTKSLIDEELESVDVVFSNPKRINEPQRVSLKEPTDIAISDDRKKTWKYREERENPFSKLL